MSLQCCCRIAFKLSRVLASFVSLHGDMTIRQTLQEIFKVLSSGSLREQEKGPRLLGFDAKGQYSRGPETTSVTSIYEGNISLAVLEVALNAH